MADMVTRSYMELVAVKHSRGVAAYGATLIIHYCSESRIKVKDHLDKMIKWLLM